MKITRDQALAVSHFCRTHNVKYASAATYPNTQAAAEKKQVRASNGMLLHFPRDPNTRWQKENPRAYVLWYGEPLENIIEALAFIKMTTRKEELIVLRCKHASKAAEAAEADGFVFAQRAALASSGSRITRTHPLEFIGMFDHKGRDNRFGNIHTYKCNTKTFSSLMANAQFVPHTNVQFVSDTTARLLYPVPAGTARVCSVLWVRRHKVRELEDAVATLLMMGHEHIVAVRSFDPP